MFSAHGCVPRRSEREGRGPKKGALIRFLTWSGSSSCLPVSDVRCACVQVETRDADLHSPADTNACVLLRTAPSPSLLTSFSHAPTASACIR